MAGNGRTMVSIEKAYELVDEMRRRFYGKIPSERITIDRSLHRRLSSDVVSRHRSPAYDISVVDGYALNTSDRYPLTLCGEVFAGTLNSRALGKGEAAYIATGAIMPDGANAVLKIEDARIEGGKLYGPKLEPWEYVIRAGSDFNAGERVLCKDTVITPSMIGMLHATGVNEVEVYRKVRVAVISTGDEIKNGLIHNTNAPMVCAMLESWGCIPENMGTVADSLEDTKKAIWEAASYYDAVITIGGVSVGKKDFVVRTLINDGDIIFHGYKVRPGKPLIVSYYNGTPVFSLPGKPAGSYTAMELIVRRFIAGETKRVSIDLPVNRDIDLSSRGFDNIIYVRLDGDHVMPMGDSQPPMNTLMGSKYEISIISASLRPMIADGFFIAHDGVRAGEIVKVNLF